MSMRNHQEKQKEDRESMDHHKNPNLETTHNHHHVPPSSSSQDFKKTHQDFKITHHQHNTHGSKKTHEDDQGFIFKNATKVIKNPTFLSSSSSSLAAGEGSTMPPPPPPPPSPPQDFKKVHHVSNKINGNEGFTMENTNSLSCSSPLPPPPPPEVAEAVVEEEESGRERLTRHRVEMAGRVRIPDIWGHEDLLKDWIDCTVFDSSLGNKSIMSARAALVQERRSTLRIENQC